MNRLAPGPIHMMSASAGTGKTHRLVDELEEAITRPDAPVRPEAVVATTFTVKAAAELRERVRSRLLEKKHVELAQRLGAARIGTVHSICGRLVTEFAFDLGISPETEVLDEKAANAAFSRALSGLVSTRRDDGDGPVTACSAAAAELMALAERFYEFEWLHDVKKLAELARANRIEPGALRECAARSAEGLLAYFDQEPGDAATIEKALQRALEAFLAAPLDATKATAGVKANANRALAQIRAGRRLLWWTWAKLAADEPGAGSKKHYEPVRLAARDVERHPGLREDLRRCIELVFELAAEALEAFARHKREWGLIDFVDQETMALDLLRRPDVQEILSDQIDLVLVDEFQDTNPIQLEIFLALSALSPRSVWVGDQKQAIYGFRGTDPALMDAAVAAILERDGSEALTTLSESWRSRAELVHLTSDLFAPVFAKSGIPADRVRLEPAKEVAAAKDTLGPVVEGWRLEGRRVDDRASALAVAIRQLLDDPQALVRDIVTNKPRRVQPGDVAVLCRSNGSCARVTTGLEAVGIPAVRPRAGLMKTLEACLALAALQLWVDPKQPLAAAEIGRLLTHPADGDQWLGQVLENSGEAYRTQPEVERLADATARLPLAGPLAAFDAAVEAVGVREACLSWGRAEQRLGNLDGLRAFVHAYVATCEREGEAATVAGLVTYLRGLDDGESDEQATLSGANAVTVSTLHGAKGLEWPVTVLFEIDSSHPTTAFGIHVMSDRERFDFADPLGGRWLRYWPDPFSPASAALDVAVSGGPEHATADLQRSREALRLLYVAWTRARDRVVVSGRPGKIVGEALGRLRDAKGAPLIVEPAPSCVWAGRRVDVQIREASPNEREKSAPEPGSGYVAAGSRAYPPARLDMSSIAGTGELGPEESLGPPLRIQTPVDWAALGTAVHGFLAADSRAVEPGERLALAAGALERWAVQSAIHAEALAGASDAFRAWCERRWPLATWHREWPVRLRHDEGTELVGYADLVLMGAERFVLIDHKCLSGTRDGALEAARGFAGQAWAYADAIAAATGKRADACFVHLVAHGCVVSVTKPEM